MLFRFTPRFLSRCFDMILPPLSFLLLLLCFDAARVAMPIFFHYCLLIFRYFAATRFIDTHDDVVVIADITSRRHHYAA